MHLAPVIRQRYFDSNGNPLAGGKLYTYQAGTSTPQATYTDEAGGAPNTNPVILDASGEASVWLDPELSYKFVLKDSSDVTQWSEDNVAGLVAPGAVITDSIADGAVTSDKLAAESVTSGKIKADASVDANRPVTTNTIRDLAVTSGKLAEGAVTSTKLGTGAVGTTSLADGSVSQAKLSSRTTGTTVAAGGVAISASSGNFSTTSTGDVTNLSVTITTTGRPVRVMLIADGSANTGLVGASRTSSSADEVIHLYRDATIIARYDMKTSVTGGTVVDLWLPQSIIETLDVVSSGTYTYKVSIGAATGTVYCSYAKLVAYEI